MLKIKKQGIIFESVVYKKGEQMRTICLITMLLIVFTAFGDDFSYEDAGFRLYIPDEWEVLEEDGAY